jgi:hypothetical protein
MRNLLRTRKQLVREQSSHVLPIFNSAIYQVIDRQS